MRRAPISSALHLRQAGLGKSERTHYVIVRSPKKRRQSGIVVLYVVQHVITYWFLINYLKYFLPYSVFHMMGDLVMRIA